MHSKQTVKYICEKYPSGSSYYYKIELITHDSWDNIDSLSWTAKRPISEATFRKRKKEGYKVEEIFINKEPAKIISFTKSFL